VTAAPVVVKVGGELLADAGWRSSCAAALSGRPLVVVHGGGPEIDAALAASGIPKRQVDGLRVTDEATLDVVVSVLAGSVNTAFVASLVGAGVPAVGLTGADAACGLSVRAPAHRSVDGRTVDLGCVGMPSDDSDTRLLRTLVDAGFVPVVACIGIDRSGALYNVNADTLAGHLAARLGASRLVVAGTTAGVLDAGGRTIPTLDADGVERLVSSGTATAGMIAKLRACEHALAGGVADVVIVNGRDAGALAAAVAGGTPAGATKLTPGAAVYEAAVSGRAVPRPSQAAMERRER